MTQCSRKNLNYRIVPDLQVDADLQVIPEQTTTTRFSGPDGTLLAAVLNPSELSVTYSGCHDSHALLRHRLLLFLGYRSGLQVWDCTNLGSVCEIVNVSGGDGWDKVTFAGVLPTPTPRNDQFLAPNRPLIGAV